MANNVHRWVLITPNWGGSPWREEFRTRRELRGVCACNGISVRTGDVYSAFDPEFGRVTIHEFVTIIR